MKVMEKRSATPREVWFSQLGPEGKLDRRQIRVGTRSRVWSPPTDVFETDDEVIVRVEVAGMQGAEFSIALENRLLTIRGARSDVAERRAYQQMEIHFGEFRTQVQLHCAIDDQGIQATYDDGFLRLVFPKAKPHAVEIGE